MADSRSMAAAQPRLSTLARLSFVLVQGVCNGMDLVTASAGASGEAKQSPITQMGIASALRA